MKKIYYLLFFALIACQASKKEYRETIDLSGQWQFALDTENEGISRQWYNKDLDDAIFLPGTTDSNQKGNLNNDTTTQHLNRVYTYEGPAWYRKKVIIPETLSDKHLVLHLERTKPSMVWVDDQLVGESMILQSPQEFDVSTHLTPGEHFITLRIDNDLKLTPYGNVHIYTDETQTNWNGVIGEIKIEASKKTFITDLQVHPDIHKKKIEVQIDIENQLNLDEITIELQVEKLINDEVFPLPSKKVTVVCEPAVRLEYELGDEMSLWDEYEQPMYRLTAVLSDGTVVDAKTVPFGMREFTTKGTQFTINGRTTFLRGKHEAGVFPLTGYTPTDVESWRRVYRIAKDYGINHYRFHSYCPPEAAFTAADLEGMYLQAELPFWGGLESDTIAGMLREEGLALMKAFGNHPSFVMFSQGNEIWSGHSRVEANLKAIKEYNPRPLYTMGSNNNIGFVPPNEVSDFFVAARTPSNGDTVLTHVRLSHGFVDSNGGGILNTTTPNTEINFEYPVSQIKVPIVSHEIGQYQIYPDYKEIDKYTGVVRAWNLEVFKKRLEEKGMGKMDSLFHVATGRWSALCYKAEMEAAIRTKGMAGFQLLDLQDFPGQGTALVGVLDAFMDSKGVVTPEEWRQSCDDVVLLLEFPTYVWTNQEQFEAKVVVANYSNQELNHELTWKLKREDGTIVQEGTIPPSSVPVGGLTDLGVIVTDFSEVNSPSKLSIEVNLQGTNYSNKYPVWVVDSPTSVEPISDVLISEKLDSKAKQQLSEGGKVLLFPITADVKGQSFAGHFINEFWNYSMFKGISEWAKGPISPGTMSILTNPKHPIFNSFPTDIHTNWQWFSILKNSNSLILDQSPAEYYPIVQVIDNLERNHKLGLIFEFKVGDGKLLVCMSQLGKLSDQPEAQQLYQSILSYMQSEEFSPAQEISEKELTKLLYGK